MTGVVKLNTSSPLKKSCPKCGKEILLYTHYRAISVACTNCNAVLFFDTTKNLNSSKLIWDSKKHEATFKIGMVFTIDEIKYRLINYAVKKETKYHTEWTEYTLFNPIEGTLFLSESDGHFNILEPTRFFHIDNSDSINYEVEGNSLNFKLYNKYKYNVTIRQGEFLFELQKNQLPYCRDYVAPPYILSSEKTASEVIWCIGKYCSHGEVKSWVKEPVSMPIINGVAPNQPYSTKYDYNNFLKLTGLSVTLLILIQVLYSALFTSHRVVSQYRFEQSDSLATRTLVSPTFEIKKSGAADFVINSFLDNNWVEANFTLINETTGEYYYFGQALEKYSGYEDGESWSEGSNTETVTVPEVSPGVYHYNVEITNDSLRRFQALQVEVIEGVTVMSNFWIALLLILVVPGISFFKKSNFERLRWYNSDYSPYNQE